MMDVPRLHWRFGGQKAAETREVLTPQTGNPVIERPRREHTTWNPSQTAILFCEGGDKSWEKEKAEPIQIMEVMELVFQ